MADDKSESGAPENTRINVYDPFELRHWSKELNVLPEAIKLAVYKVGTSVEAVKKFLKR